MATDLVIHAILDVSVIPVNEFVAHISLLSFSLW